MTITRSYYQCAHGAIICFSVADRSSFQSAFEETRGWVPQSRKYLLGLPILVGCKNDLKQERQVSKEEAEVIIIEMKAYRKGTCVEEWDVIF